MKEAGKQAQRAGKEDEERENWGNLFGNIKKKEAYSISFDLGKQVQNRS